MSREIPDVALEANDCSVAALLAYEALVEIRILAGPVHARLGDLSPTDTLERIRFLANLCHNMPLITRAPAIRPSRRGVVSERERAMAERPMSWTWNTAGPEGQRWILNRLEEAGRRWTPPPPLPTPRKGVPSLTACQRVRLLTGWPVKTPSGREPLPRQSRLLKAADAETINALFEEAGRLRLGLGQGSPWLRAHVDAGATHFVFPDPASYYWPNPDAGRLWWQCRVLLQMVDGEQVSTSVSVLPETFTALPSTVSRFRQRVLVHIARATQRDTGLWARDHEAACSPQQCGYAPVEATQPSGSGSSES